MSIKYLKGDATNPIGNEKKIICHICNDIGGWGRGFVLALSKRWKIPESEYRQWHNGHSIWTKDEFKLGNVQIVQVEHNVWVANMISQHDIVSHKGIPPIRYEALTSCLDKVTARAKEIGATIHGPRFGAGLAGGNWSKIEEIIEATCQDIPVYIYDL